MSWTDERVEILTKLWADGLSASQIAKELGGVTRNAVIGKVHRLGLSGRAKAPSSSAKRAKRAPRAGGYSTRQSRATTRVNGRKSPNPSVISRPALEDLVAPEPKKLDLVELSDKRCKWPFGDPATDEFYFCGHAVKDEQPYCEYHSALAYQQAPDRKRERRAS